MRGLLTPLLAGLAARLAVAVPKDEVFAWASVEYEWEAWTQEGIEPDGFEREKNAITGIKVWRSPSSTQLRTFVTVPRWKRGVPATLAEVVPDSAGKPLLRPYPSARMNSLSTAASQAVRYIQSMEVTPDGIMWIVDVGRMFFADPPAVDGQPSLLLWDIEKDVQVDRYDFPEDVASSSSSFLNDIVVDVTRRTAYISDAGTGGIVVVDLNKRTSRSFHGPSTANDPTYSWVIDGIAYGNSTLTAGADGIALLPDGETLFWCPCQGTKLYSIGTHWLRSGAGDDEIERQVKIVGDKGQGGPADGMVATRDGTIFTGRNADPDLALALYSGSGDPSRMVSLTHARWIDTFGFDDATQDLYWTSNHLEKFFAGTMDFSGSHGPNFIIYRIATNTTSYLTPRVVAGPQIVV